jgi:hypothetical protein
MVHVGCLISHLMCVCVREAIWAGPDNALGGQCMVALSKVTRPVELGGLGVQPHIIGLCSSFALALLAKVDPDRISSLPTIQRPSINKEEKSFL